MNSEKKKLSQKYKPEYNKIALDVWKNKYRLGEETLDGTINRIKNAIKQKTLEKFKDKGLSNHRKIKYFIENIDSILDDIIGFDKIIPAGSAIFGLGNDITSSISNCFVIDSPHDSLEGINHSINEMCILEKARGGVGVNLSSLRPKNSEVNNQSEHSTGVCTFVKDFSNNNNVVAQDGRRGALMICLDINHPDIMDFISLKSDLSIVTGANLSIVIDDIFMGKINDTSEDNLYMTKFPVTSDLTIDDVQFDVKDIGQLFYDNDTKTYWKILKVRDVWDSIIQNAWKNAEPGVLFKDNWYNHGTDGIYKQYAPICTNPCSEIAMGAYDSCRLISYNLKDLVVNPFQSSAFLDYDKASVMFYYQLLIADILIDIEIDKINSIIDKVMNDDAPDNVKVTIYALYQRIKENTIDGRRCGCGFTGLADLMAMTNISFRDFSMNNVNNIIDNILKIKLRSELDCSIDLAEIFGSFKGFDSEKDVNQPLWNVFKNDESDILQDMKKYGRRNVSFSTVAPTGTVSLIAGCTSGIEPLFEPYYKRRVKVIDRNIQRVDFIDDNGVEFSEYNNIHTGLIEYYAIKNDISYIESENILTKLSDDELQNIFKASPYYGEIANDIDYNNRICLQALVQKYTTHSISSTLNLPNNIDKNTIFKIYEDSWISGLKGNTVYRDGSRSGILLKKGSDTNKKFRTKILKSKMNTINYKNNVYGVIISFDEITNNPYEIFILGPLNFLKKVERKVFNGQVIKDDEGDYNFYKNENDINTQYDLDQCEYLIELRDLDSMESKDMKLLSLFISRMLRNNITMHDIIKTIIKGL